MLKRLLVGVGLSTALIGGTAAPAQAHTDVAFANRVDYNLVVPSVLAPNGAYQVTVKVVGASQDFCGFYLYRSVDGGGFSYKGRYYGTSTNDQLQTYWYSVQYAVTPLDCNGNDGDPVYTVAIDPTVLDDPFYVWSGSANTVHTNKAYGGSMLQGNSIGTRLRFRTDWTYNVGLVAGTGPAGGIGTVYVDGVRKGTINFRSSRPAYKKVLFKFGTASPQYHTVDVVTTGRGASGGTKTWLDAGVENIG